MPNLLKLQALLPQIEEAEVTYNLRTRDTYDDAKVAAATAEFNKVLGLAATAIIDDLGIGADANKYLDEWRPKDSADTWFGLEPCKFIHHVLRDGGVHRMGLPDEWTVH